LSKQYVTFGIGKEVYGISIDIVVEIIKMTEITKLPRTQEFVEGIINLRGRIIPIIDMKKQFFLGKHHLRDENRIIVVDINDETVGLIVEEVHEVLSLDEANIEKVQGTQLLKDTGLIKGIGKWQEKLIIIIEPKVILAPEEVEQLKVVLRQAKSLTP